MISLKHIISSQAAFTLIEILVAISIISVLFVVTVATGAAVQRAGRDARRTSDLRSIQSALQQFYADQQYFPASAQVVIGNPLSFNGRTYLNNLPKDPNTGSNNYPQYLYLPSPTTCTNADANSRCTSYILCAKAEVAGSNLAPSCPAPYNMVVTLP